MASISDNVGMGMMGQDVAFAQKAMQGDEKSKAALRMMLGGGLDSLADMISGQSPDVSKGISSLSGYVTGKSPEGSAPSPAFDSSKMDVMKPVVPADYSLSGTQPQAPAQPQVAGAVMPIQQLNTATTDQTQPAVGSYRKFLRFQDFGSTQQ
jgi:hypothetical protein